MRASRPAGRDMLYALECHTRHAYYYCAALAELGMEVVTFDIAADVAASKEQIRDLAALAGDEPAGARLIARIDAALLALLRLRRPLLRTALPEGGREPPTLPTAGRARGPRAARS